jgi:hypothetical protein
MMARKNFGSHIDASHSRQPLVKGERLVRNEVNAVMPPQPPHDDAHQQEQNSGVFELSAYANKEDCEMSEFT